MSIDMPLWNVVQENKPDIVADYSGGSILAIRRRPIFDKDGGWEYGRFELAGAYRNAAWPRTITGAS